MVLCTNCGRSRHGDDPHRRCTCLPDPVWETPEMIAAIERMDIIEVVQILRSNPLTRHLSQTALSRLIGVSQSTVSKWESGDAAPNPRRIVDVLQRLGVPGVPWGHRWLLPEELTADTAPEPAQVQNRPTPCVVITVPGPLHVQVIQTDQDGAGPTAGVAFVVDQKGPRLMVTPDSTWGVTISPTGATAWVVLHPGDHSGLIVQEST